MTVAASTSRPIRNDSSRLAQSKNTGTRASTALRLPRWIVRWRMSSSRASRSPPHVSGETWPTPATPPRTTPEPRPPVNAPAGFQTTPMASNAQTADHQRPGPGRRMLSRSSTVRARTRALIATSAPAPTCSAKAVEATGSFRSIGVRSEAALWTSAWLHSKSQGMFTQRLPRLGVRERVGHHRRGVRGDEPAGLELRPDRRMRDPVRRDDEDEQEHAQGHVHVVVGVPFGDALGGPGLRLGFRFRGLGRLVGVGGREGALGQRNGLGSFRFGHQGIVGLSGDEIRRGRRRVETSPMLGVVRISGQGGGSLFRRPRARRALTSRGPYLKCESSMNCGFDVRRRDRRPRAKHPMRVLTAIPVYNEEAHLEAVLTEVLRHAEDVLVVDDGSKDRTPELLRSFPGVQVIRHPTNRGYGAGLKSAFRRTLEGNYDGLVTLDCDGQHEPSLIPEVAAHLAEADIVSGSRYLKVFDPAQVPPRNAGGSTSR